MKKEFIIERQGKNFVLYAGLLEEAHEHGLKEITTSLIQIPTPENNNVAVCHAVVETEKGRFTGLGDASPENVSSMMRVHLIRMAETRAKARALRDAVNVGVAALEELAEDESSPVRPAEHARTVEASRSPEPARSADAEDAFVPVDNLSLLGDPEPRSLGPRAITEKQLKAIYAIGQNTCHLSKADLEAKCQDIYGYAPQDLSRWEASQFIDLLKQDKVA